MSIDILRTTAGAALAALSLGVSAPSQAHHSFAAEFDSKKLVKVEGTVTKARIMNPHSWLYVDVRSPDGTVTNWGFEFGTPVLLKAKNIGKEDIPPGSRIGIEGFKAKNGGAFGYCAIVTLADGRKIQIGSAPDAPTVTASR